MGFTDLISRIPSGKAFPISHYDEEFVVANFNKINKSFNPSEKLRITCSAIGSNLENSDYALLRNYPIVAALKLINSTFPIYHLITKEQNFVPQIAFQRIILKQTHLLFLFLTPHFFF